MEMRALVAVAALVCGAHPATVRADALDSETWDGRAETGAHCGYVNEMANGERAVFSLLVNKFGKGVTDQMAIDAVDRFAAELVRPRGEPLPAGIAD